MKILVLADLHLDEVADKAVLRRLGEEIALAGQEADAMIIAGDLTEQAAQRWSNSIKWLGAHYPSEQTVILPGNHDYYGGHLDTLDADLDRICREAGCGFGQCRRMDLGDTRILMTTLWTDMRLFEAEGEAAVADSLWNARMMPDYGYDAITTGAPERELEPEDTIAVHERQKSWLISELAKPWPGKTVVITHHAPSASVAGAMSPLSPCFASELDDLIARYRSDAWIFGHTHRHAEMRMPGGTLLRNVSVGYENEFSSEDIGDRVRRGVIDLFRLDCGSG